MRKQHFRIYVFDSGSNKGYLLFKRRWLFFWYVYYPFSGGFESYPYSIIHDFSYNFLLDSVDTCLHLAYKSKKDTEDDKGNPVMVLLRDFTVREDQLDD